jgi:hypothetical protein
MTDLIASRIEGELSRPSVHDRTSAGRLAAPWNRTHSHIARRPRSSYLVLASTLLTMACGASSSGIASVAPLPCPNGGFDAAARSAADTTIHALTLFLPPLPPPRALFGRQAVIRLVVDSSGKALPDSTVVCGIADAKYARRVADAANRTPFTPAAPNGRPRPASIFVTMDF